MIKNLFYLFIFLYAITLCAQKKSTDFRSKQFTVINDTIQIDTISINATNFKVLTSKKKEIQPQEYLIDFKKSELIISKKKYNRIIVEYYRYPNFITKIYSPFDKKLIVPNTTNTGKLYSATTNKKKGDLKLFDGLKTQGFITRGITSGNNQNAVTNSSLDLSIEGKLSKNVSIRANIFDTNLPLQEGGYSQNITDFDRIFVELFNKDWKVTAGDISLENTNSYFLKFNKQVSGLQVDATINKKTKVLASGAIVRGKFTTYDFVGTEGNQGPYKVFGPNNDASLIIVEGSDKVFINGSLLERGETKDYTINYNLAEIQFNNTYPITNDMRIKIEFQYSDNNYTRFITYNETHFKNNIFSLSGYFYNENDAKNQPVQQSLTTNQQEILANAGDDLSLMTSESAFLDAYSASKIQYKKTVLNAIEVFEYSTNETDELYTVSFKNVGTNLGSYTVDSTIAIGTIYTYVGENLGDYAPIILLAAPEKKQVAVFNFNYQPSQKTIISSELALSNNDLNLFSTIDDEENEGIASKFYWQQVLSDKKWQLSSIVDYQFIEENFSTVQRFQNVEFSRDWNLLNPTGDQQQISAGFLFKNPEKGFISYSFNHLNFSNNFNGNQHQIQSKLTTNKTSFIINGSLLNNTSLTEKSDFLRLNSTLEHSLGKPWLGAFINVETNDRKDAITKEHNITSHKFKEYEGYLGLGDSTNVYVKFGINYRENDSVKTAVFTQVNNRKTGFIDSRIIQKKNTNLSLYANYKVTENRFLDDEKALISKVTYNQRFLKNALIFGTVYETSSGNIAQQDYVYIETEAGQGYYTWVDYNENSIQDFDEFEVTLFQDQANYLRVALPNLTYLPTQTVKLKQSVTLNPSQWKTKTTFKKLISHFYNQTYLSIENQQNRIGEAFNLNPFNLDENNLLGLNYNLRNNFYFNRGLQKYSATYTYGESSNKQQYSIGNQEGNTFIHQFDFQHKLTEFWLLDFKTTLGENELETENLTNRNYNITTKELHPKLTFLYNKDHRLSFFYQFKEKENRLENFEFLKQQKMGLDYFFISKKKNQISANFTMFLNDFNGDQNTPVGYQMLEGLQPGNNYTWNLLFNQKLTSILNLTLNYSGRKSEDSKIIHTGMIQLKALF